MQTSPHGRALIESFEGLRLTSYQDQRGVWTIGYGSTQNVTPGMTITQKDADARLANDLHAAEQPVNGLVTVPMTQNQFDALVSLCFNIGSGNFAHSTLLRLMNEGDTAGASGQFLAWCKTDGQVNQGLLNRRHTEMQLFDTEVAG